MNIPLGIPSFPSDPGTRFSVKGFLANNKLKYIPNGWPKVRTLLRLLQVVLLSAANYWSRPTISKSLWLSKPGNSWEPVVQFIQDGYTYQNAASPAIQAFLIDSYMYANLGTVSYSAISGSRLGAADATAEVKQRIESARPGATFVITDSANADKAGYTLDSSMTPPLPNLARQPTVAIDNGDMPIPISYASSEPYARHISDVFTPNLLVVHVGTPYFDSVDYPSLSPTVPGGYYLFPGGLGYGDAYLEALKVGSALFPGYAVRAFSDGIPSPTVTVSGVDLSPLESWVDYNGHVPSDIAPRLSQANSMLQPSILSQNSPIPDSLETYQERQANFKPEGIDYRCMGIMPTMDADAIVDLIAKHFGFETP